MSVDEWESDNPHAILEIPLERTQTQRFKFTAKDAGLSGTCAMYELVLHGIELTDVLIDTSERFQATILKKRVTHRASVLIVNTSIVIFPFNPDEQ
jgi:hypothetical protein